MMLSYLLDIWSCSITVELKLKPHISITVEYTLIAHVSITVEHMLIPHFSRTVQHTQGAATLTAFSSVLFSAFLGAKFFFYKRSKNGLALKKQKKFLSLSGGGGVRPRSDKNHFCFSFEAFPKITQSGRTETSDSFDILIIIYS